MGVSKLFSPALREKGADGIEATERTDMFMNTPTHPEVSQNQGATDTGQPWYPLHLSESSQKSTPTVEKRKFITVNEVGEY